MQQLNKERGRSRKAYELPHFKQKTLLTTHAQYSLCKQRKTFGIHTFVKSNAKVKENT